MKYFPVLFFVVILTEKSSSHKTCCKNATLDITALKIRYQNVINRIAEPTLEFGDEAAGIFKNASAQAISNYGFSLVLNLHTQAWASGNKLIDDVHKSYHKLLCAISLINPHHHYSKSNCLDGPVQNLTIQMEKFLTLEPGKSKFESPVLPLVAEEQIKVANRSEIRPPEEIFLNTEFTVFDISQQVYAYLTHLYILSLHESEPIYAIIRTFFYDEIINCPVLGNYTQIAIDLLEKRYLIRRNVKPEVWACFRNVTDQVIAISEAYCGLPECYESSEEDHRSFEHSDFY